MDIHKLAEMAGQAAKTDRLEGGQQTVGYLIDMLSVIDRDLPIVWDTGHQFGNAPIEWEHDEGFAMAGYFQAPSDSARSETAHPSCYRGYYIDLTFNCSTEYEPSTVGHVLDMANDVLGRALPGYKGGAYTMDRGSMVWGGGSSWSSTDSGMFSQVIVDELDGKNVCILLTVSDDD